MKLMRLGPRFGVCCLALILSACGGAGAEVSVDDTSVVSELRSAAERVVPGAAEAAGAARGEEDFAFSFLHALEADGNVAFSPHSISTAFAMATDAAAGQTLRDIERALGFPRADEAFHRSQDALKLGLAARNRDSIETEEERVDAQILRESNDIWIRNDAPPERSFLDTLARFYGASVHQADFENNAELARVAINAKVAEDTRQLITELLPEDSIDASAVAVLTNALYFKAPWATAFAAPSPGQFRTLSEATIDVKMLKQRSTLAYYEGTGYVSVAVPYWGGDLEMMLVVPDAGRYAEVRANLSSELLATMLSGRQATDVQLALPQFSLRSTVPAMRSLMQLGMTAPFAPAMAEFPKLASASFPQVYISNVFHQATVAIDEKGTEASAATAIVFSGISSVDPEPPMPKAVTIDRPFLFVIRDNPTGAVLFVGQVVDPTLK
jgi:serpin B